MKKTTLGLAMCGSFCTFSRVLDAFEALDRERFDLVPIMSQVSFETDSRFGPVAQFRERLEALCGREIVHTIEEAEPFGPKNFWMCSLSCRAQEIRSPNWHPALPTGRSHWRQRHICGMNVP